jgi:hypothetical protein
MKTWKLLPLAFAFFIAASSQTVSADQPICQVLCATTHCTTQADCPEGHCDFACPGEGCCVTP